MEIWTILLALYAGMTAVALFLTFRERRLRKAKSPVHILLGYGLCTVWPVVAAVMVILQRPALYES